jgi:hypothetical protein
VQDFPAEVTHLDFKDYSPSAAECAKRKNQANAIDLWRLSITVRRASAG